jgi:hypothetical protein
MNAKSRPFFVTFTVDEDEACKSLLMKRHGNRGEQVFHQEMCKPFEDRPLSPEMMPLFRQLLGRFPEMSGETQQLARPSEFRDDMPHPIDNGDLFFVGGKSLCPSMV